MGFTRQGIKGLFSSILELKDQNANMGFAVMITLSEGHFNELILDVLPHLSITRIRFYKTIIENLSLLILRQEFNETVA